MERWTGSHNRPSQHLSQPLFLLLFLLLLTSPLPVTSSISSSAPNLLSREPLCQRSDLVIPRHLHLVRRSEPARVFSEQPLRECKRNIYCLPSPNVTWYYDEASWIQWNNQNERFVSGSRQVNIYLYERIKPDPSTYNEHNLLAAFKNIENASGLYNLTVSDTIISNWTPSFFSAPGSSNTTRAHFVVVTWPENTLDAEKGEDFFISSQIRPGSSHTTEPVSPISAGAHPTVTQTIALDPVYLDEESSRRDVIIIGTVCSGMFLAFLGLVFVFMRRKQKRKNEMRDSLPTGSSTTPIITEKAPTAEIGKQTIESSPNDTAAMLLPSDAAVAPATLTSPDDDGPISSSDARLIALTYRQMLRKPTWQTMPGEEAPEDEEERKEAEKEARRRSEAIMQRELQEEGRGLKTVSVHSMYEGNGTTSGSVRTSSTSSPAPEYRR